MKIINKVQGSIEQAKPLIVGKDTVYVHTNIVQILEDNEGNEVDNLYEYDEIQYTKDEYIKELSDKNEELENNQIDLQLALCELYEGSVLNG